MKKIIFLTLFCSLSLAQNTPSKKTYNPQVGEIEEPQVRKYQRRHESLNLTSLGFGPFSSSKIGENGILYGFSYGKIWETSDVWEIRGDGLLSINGKGLLVSAGIGPSWIPMTGNFSPFIGGQLGLGYAKGNEDSEANFSGQFNVGLKMFRLSNAQMEILGSYTTILSSKNLSVYGLQLRLLYP